MNDDGLISGADAAPVSETVLRARLATFKVEHQDLDAAVCALEAKPRPDQIQIARLKKKKLRLRDEIARLEDQLLPDIIA
jgi:hypothetical protein